MDDTNPTKEDVEYVDSIIADVKWLIGGWAEDRLGFKPAGKTPEAVDQRRQAGLLSRAASRRSCGRQGWSRSTPPITSTKFTSTPSA